MNTYDGYPAEVVTAFKSRLFGLGHTGGGVMAWSREDEKKNLYVWVASDDPEQGWEGSEAGIDVMDSEGNERYSTEFPSLRDAYAYAVNLFELDSKERFRQDMIAWLVKEDGNGCFTDEDSVAEGGRPMTTLQGMPRTTTTVPRSRQPLARRA